MPRRRVLVALLAGVLAGAGLDAADAASSRHRLGAADEWRHCVIDGESRPAATCPVPALVTSHKGRRIPADGELVIALPPTPPPGARVAVSVEAYAYADAPVEAAVRTALKTLTAVLQKAQRPDALGGLAALDDRFAEIPQPPLPAADRVPDSVTVRLPAARGGDRVAYAVWVWPIEAREVRVPFAPSAGDSRLTLAAGVHDVAARLDVPAVRFTARLLDPAGAELASLWTHRLDPTSRPSDRGWHEQVVDLAPWVGRRLVLALEAATVAGDAASHVGTWAQPLLDVPARAGVRHRSVLLLSLDTLRADHLGAAGYARATTPRLDALAASGFLFTRGWAPFPSTTASHMSMLTSLLPCAHRVTVPAATLAAGVPTLAELFADAGFATAGITENALIAGKSGFNRGFDRYWDQRPDQPLGTFPDGIALATAWLRDVGERPFFLFLHTYQVHIPYKIAPHLADLFPVADDASEAERQRADYDTGLRYADEVLGGFLDVLAARGILHDLVLVVTSDHGTEFGEHGGIGHARGVHTEQLHVPLIVHHPPLGGGRRIDDLAEVIDVPRTVLELAGVPVPETLRGTSLVPALRGEALGLRDVFGEQLWGARETSLRRGTHTWIRDQAGVRLYDPHADPFEQHDLAAASPALADEGRRVIDEFRTACQREHGAVSRTGIVIDPDRAEALRRLGYVE